MTQTVRRIPRQRADARRLGIVYAYDTLKVDQRGVVSNTGIEVGYVGKTVQKLSARDDQHRGIAGGPDGAPAKCQPWSDLIVGGVRILEQGMWTDAELADRERFWIEQLRPAYNHEFNLGNPGRVPIFVARRQRDVRDEARGVTAQQWAPTPTRRRWWPLVTRLVRSRWLWRAVAFLAVLAAVSRAADEIGQYWTFTTRLALASGVFAGVWLWWRLEGRRRWRRLKRAWR